MLQRPDFEHEIILVNDCSPDNTWQVIQDIARKDKRVTAINLAKNVGQPNALLAGFHHVSGDLIMTSDDDGQTPIDRVFDFYDELQKGYDVVCARYTERNQPSFFRRMGSAMNRTMSDFLIEKPKDVYMAAVFMAKRFVIDEMTRYRHPYPYISGLLLRTTQNIGNVDVEQRSRVSGESGYTLAKLLRLWLNGFTAFSIKPLRVASITGFILALIGFATAIGTAIRKILVPTIAAGWSSMIAVLLLVGGLILIFLGLIGEYIGRIYMCINETPQFLIKDIAKQKPDGTTSSDDEN